MFPRVESSPKQVCSSNTQRNFTVKYSTASVRVMDLLNRFTGSSLTKRFELSWNSAHRHTLIILIIHSKYFPDSDWLKALV